MTGGRLDLPLRPGDFEAARRRVAPQLHRTPLLSFRTLGRGLCGVLGGAGRAAGGHAGEVAGDAGEVQVWLKCENLQKTGSFKVRGALNAISALGEAERARGVITISAGNHAQAVAWAARRSGVRAVVVMPEAAARTKVEAAKGYGAEVILHGTGTQAFVEARRRADEEGLVFLHPFDAPEVIAGHGSTGLEIAEDLETREGGREGAEADGAGTVGGATGGAAGASVVVPVGGGGQIAGIAGALAASGRLGAGGWRVWGVEPEGAPCMRRSLDAGGAATLEGVDTIADGLAAPMAGDLTYRYVRALVRDVVLVSDREIMAAMRLLMTRAKVVAEPSGAAAVAALMFGRVPVPAGGRVVAVVTGGNADPDVLSRALLEAPSWP